MKQFVKTFILLLIVTATGFYGGLNYIADEELKLQTSEHTWRGEYIEDLIAELCCRDGIDFEGNWIFNCPKWDCRGATYTHFRNKGGLIKGFLFTAEKIEKIDPGECVAIKWTNNIYCAKCKYPLGYDWEIVGFDGDDN